MSDMRSARACETARRTEKNGYKVTRLQGYSVTTGTGAQPRPLAELQNRFQIPNCKEMTKNSRNSSLLQSRRGRGCAPTEVTTWPGNHATSTATNKFRYVVQSAGRARHSVRAAVRRQLSERRARSDAPYHVSKFVCHSTNPSESRRFAHERPTPP